MTKTVIVTGGAKGIGEAISRALAKDGYFVALCYNSSQNKAESIKNEINSHGGKCEVFKCDVSDSSQVKKMYRDVVNSFGEPYALVNNAGVAEQKLFTDITDEDWQRMIGTDLSGTFYCCREVLPSMINNKNGKIVNIASMWGEVGASMEVHYSAAKAGVIGLTKALAKEVGLSGITVNTVSPGVIMTDMMSKFSSDDINALKDETPLDKLGTPENVADAVLFLLSEKADFITGQVLSVNGGFVI